AMKKYIKATSNIQQLNAITLDPEANMLDPEANILDPKANMLDSE
ncbi:16087_t:CDS:1, partial [Racocetra fulgida]